MSPTRRDTSLPRTAGTMQNVHELLQPIEIDTHACHGELRRAGSAEGKTSVCSRISKLGASSDSRRSRGRLARLWVPSTTSTYGAFCWIRA